MAEVHPIFVFEVAMGIDLDQVEQVLAGAERQSFRHRGRATTLFQHRPAPLRVSQEGASLGIGPWQTDPVADLVLYDFGAASVAYHLPVPGGPEELSAASVFLRQAGDLRADARARAGALLQSIGAAAHKPRVADFTEDYAIFGLRELPQGVSAGEFCDSQIETIARILRPDAGGLSGDEIRAATELRISFGPSDMTIVDWDGAFVMDPDPEDVRVVLEFANVQLLEMRWLDLQLDNAIGQSYRLVSQRRRSWAFLPGSVHRGAQQVAELQLESAVMLERVTNALKIFGEVYLARIYRLAARRFQLAELDATISRKLSTIESIYQKLSDRAATTRMEVLEWVVIILIALEVVLGLVR